MLCIHIATFQPKVCTLQHFMLTQRHQDVLREEFGVHVWHFEQHECEAVFIPAACAHAVRNLRSCIKVGR